MPPERSVRIFDRASGFHIDRANITVVVQSNSDSTSPDMPLPSETAPQDERGEYVRLLLPKRRGFPLWSPAPGEWLPRAYRDEGVSIGDVGILTNDGQFDYLFNACRPADDPINRGRVPEDFRPIQGVDINNIRFSTSAYENGDFVASNCADFSKRVCYPSDGLIPGVPPEVGAGLEFRSQATRGALLILPEGGIRKDHQQLGRFSNYARDCATSWFTYINQNQGRQVEDLYLITGFDKTRAWGVTAFAGLPRDGEVFLKFVPRSPQIAGNQPEYRFRRHDSVLKSAGTVEDQSACIFLRGFRITVRSSLFFRTVPEIIHTSSMQWGSGEGTHLPRGNASTLWSSLVPGARANAVAGKTPVYHPSDVINRWILDQFKDVQMVITHDNDWASVVPDDADEILNPQLIRMINAKHINCSRSRKGLTYACFSPDARTLNSQGSKAPSLPRQQSNSSGINWGIATPNLTSIMKIMDDLISTAQNTMKHGITGGQTDGRAETIIRDCHEFVKKVDYGDQELVMATERDFYDQMEDSLRAAERNIDTFEPLVAQDKRWQPELRRWTSISETIDELLDELQEFRKNLETEIQRSKGYSRSIRNTGRTASTSTPHNNNIHKTLSDFGGPHNAPPSMGPAYGAPVGTMPHPAYPPTTVPPTSWTSINQSKGYPSGQRSVHGSTSSVNQQRTAPASSVTSSHPATPAPDLMGPRRSSMAGPYPTENLNHRLSTMSLDVGSSRARSLRSPSQESLGAKREKGPVKTWFKKVFGSSSDAREEGMYEQASMAGSTESFRSTSSQNRPYAGSSAPQPFRMPSNKTTQEIFEKNKAMRKHRRK